jgi:predicted dehydrogenase
LVKEKEIEAVYVLTPNKSHAAISVAAMKAGKHVMCEKPMAKSYADAKLMLDTAKETGKILTIGYQNRYRQDSIYLKRACENGDLETYYARHMRSESAVSDWGVFLNEEEQGATINRYRNPHAYHFGDENYEPESVTGLLRKLAERGTRQSFR